MQPDRLFPLRTALMSTTSTSLWSDLDQSPSETNLSPDTAAVRRDREWKMRLARADIADGQHAGLLDKAGCPR